MQSSRWFSDLVLLAIFSIFAVQPTNALPRDAKNLRISKRDPAPWNDPYGPVPVGYFSYFIIPQWSGQAAGGAPSITVYLQDGSSQGSVTYGPFDIDCSISENDFQSVRGAQTTLPFDIVFQSGHVCAGGLANHNYDGLHIKYANQYKDVPEGIHDRTCIKHDGGVSCNFPIRP